MANLYLFKYNSYYNKIIKREENIEGYGEALNITERVNFNPADGVRTIHIINAGVDISGADYCVVTTDSGAIESRWYIMEKDRTRGGQYRLQLLRDVIAEYKEEFLSSTCFMEKGWVNQENPLIFNNEGMGFNQIKVQETLLENNLQTPWIILYLSRYNNEGAFNTFEGSFTDALSGEPDYTFDKIQDYPYFYISSLTQNPSQRYSYLNEDTMFFGVCYASSDTPQNNQLWWTSLLRIWRGGDEFNSNYDGFPKPAPFASPVIVSPSGKNFNVGNSLYTTYRNGVNTVNGIQINTYTGRGTPGFYRTLQKENGKTIKAGDKTYRIQVRYVPETISEIRTEIAESSALGQRIKQLVFTNNGIDTTNKTGKYFIYGYPNGTSIWLDLMEMNSRQLSYNISYDKIVTRDSSYEILAAPLYDRTYSAINGDVSKSVIHKGDIALEWFQAIINKYHASSFAYDLQIVPYCPVDTNVLSNYESVLLTNDLQEEGAPLALAIKLPQASFSGQIEKSGITLRSDKKESNELDIYRLVSPGGVGEYEWSPSKNGGTVSQFEYDCTLIPFNPYIKVNPVFSTLYGGDYNDYRGLICGGDFSLPIVSSEWESYQLQNKYYQDIFNRGIAHQEFNNNQERIREGFSFVGGVLGGAAQGAQIGGGAGAIVGGTLAAAGGIADMIMNEQARQENLNYQKDNFNFQLGTIKARAQSLTRTTAYNINNKYFPYVEYYTCTETEVQAYRNKIKYSGMTLGVIGSPQDYINPASGELTFVRGTLIEINIPDDLQLIMEIRKRFEGGIRINGS